MPEPFSILCPESQVNQAIPELIRAYLVRQRVWSAGTQTAASHKTVGRNPHIGQQALIVGHPSGHRHLILGGLQVTAAARTAQTLREEVTGADSNSRETGLPYPYQDAEAGLWMNLPCRRHRRGKNARY